MSSPHIPKQTQHSSQLQQQRQSSNKQAASAVNPTGSSAASGSAAYGSRGVSRGHGQQPSTYSSGARSNIKANQPQLLQNSSGNQAPQQFVSAAKMMADSIRKKKHPLVSGRSGERDVPTKPLTSASSIANNNSNNNCNRVALTSQMHKQSAHKLHSYIFITSKMMHQSNQDTLVVKLDNKANGPSDPNPYYASGSNSNKKKIKMFG